MTEPSSPVVIVGSSGDRLTDVGGVVAVCSGDGTEVVGVVVVVWSETCVVATATGRERTRRDPGAWSAKRG